MGDHEHEQSRDPLVHVGEQEGVIHFQADHTKSLLSPNRFEASVRRLNAWRRILVALGLIGRDPCRYGGAGYGNISHRTGPYPGPRGARPFIVTGTQTGDKNDLLLSDYALVRAYNLTTNRVSSEGSTLPSSEAMTHGAIYDLGAHIRCVFHVHCPTVWAQRNDLRIPTTPSTIGYGTVGMAEAVKRLARETSVLDSQVLAMAGHKDGLIAFGRTPKEAGEAIIGALARALANGQSDSLHRSHRNHQTDF